MTRHRPGLRGVMDVTEADEQLLGLSPDQQKEKALRNLHYVVCKHQGQGVIDMYELAIKGAREELSKL